MTVSEARAMVVKVLKAQGAKARRGHLRLQVGELYWYVDPRVTGVGQRAALSLEVGCWLPDLTPEPEGGAVDCPLLLDVSLADPTADTNRLLDLISTIGNQQDLAARLGELSGALVDRALRDLLAP